MVGAIGSFVVALVMAIMFLKFFKIRLPSAVVLALYGILVVGFIGIGLGFLGINKVSDNGLAKVTGILFIVLGVVSLSPLLALVSPAIGAYGMYGIFAVGAITFALGALAATQTKDRFGGMSKIVIPGFWAIAAYQVFQLVTLLVVMNLPLRVVQIVSIAFLIAQVGGIGAAGVAFWNLRKGEA